MKKLLTLFILFTGIFTSVKAQQSQEYINGFKSGVEVGEYYKYQVLLAHPEYSIGYAVKYYQVDYANSGGLNLSSGTYSYTAGYTAVYEITSDPNNYLANIMSDHTIVVQGGYLINQFNTNPTDFNHGIMAGFYARVSGKVGDLEL